MVSVDSYGFCVFFGCFLGIFFAVGNVREWGRRGFVLFLLILVVFNAAGVVFFFYVCLFLFCFLHFFCVSWSVFGKPAFIPKPLEFPRASLLECVVKLGSLGGLLEKVGWRPAGDDWLQILR